MRRQRQLLISTQRNYRRQAFRPTKRFARQNCDRIEHCQHVTPHANDTEYCHRRVGQSRRYPGFRGAVNLISKDSKDSISSYEGNKVMKLRLVRRIAQAIRVDRWTFMLRFRAAHAL